MTGWQLFCQLHFEDLVVLGTVCRAHGCSNVASWDVCWPGASGPSPQCTHHRDRCARVAAALGFELVSFARPVREPEPADASARRFELLELN